MRSTRAHIIYVYYILVNGTSLSYTLTRLRLRLRARARAYIILYDIGAKTKPDHITYTSFYKISLYSPPKSFPPPLRSVTPAIATPVSPLIPWC